MAYASIALLATCAAPLGAAAVRTSAATVETCTGNSFLQVERGAGSRAALTKLVADPEVPELPPPYTAEMGEASSVAEGEHDASFLQREAPSAVELEHFRLLKDLRRNGHRCPGGRSFAGIPNTEATFKFDCRLWRAARYWSAEMGQNSFFSHVRGDSNPCQRTSGYGLTACSENIAAGNPDPEKTLQQFMDSDGHCVNMMDSQLNRFGAGFVETPGSQWTHYWTQSMGVDNEAADESCLQNAPTPGGAPAPGPAPQPPSFSGPCEDKDVHCASSYSAYCDTENIQNTCPKTCGLCTATPAPAPPAPARPAPAPPAPQPPSFSGPCEDKDRYCSTSYSSYCNLQNIQSTCPKTCGLCTARAPSAPAPSAPSPRCEDKDMYCATSYSSYCNLQNIQSTCPKTCGLC